MTERLVEDIDNDDDDDIPRLSEHTLAALREFYADQTACDAPTGIREDWVGSKRLFNPLTVFILMRY